jgi:hypothetical protein
MNVAKVTAADAARFAKTWTLNGVAHLMDAVHLQFAADLANAAVLGFIQNYMAQQAAAQAPKIISTE